MWSTHLALKDKATPRFATHFLLVFLATRKKRGNQE